MDVRELSNTGVEVTRLGLGAGGGSRLGLAQGRSSHAAEAVLLAAIDAGLNYVDTATVYGTEDIVGRALQSRPDHSVVVSTKFRHRTPSGALLEPAALRTSVEDSLRALRREHVDILFLHGVRPHEYDHCRAVLLPDMEDLRERGLVRAIGVTESFANDPSHDMAARALADGCWDVLMLGYNLLNPSAHDLIERAQDNETSIIGMFAVRWLLTGPARLRDGMRAALASQDEHLDRPSIEQALEQLASMDVEGLLPGAAYHFALAHPGIASVLMGTGDRVHLCENLESLERVGDDPRLPALIDTLEGVLNGTRSGSGDDPAIRRAAKA